MCIVTEIVTMKTVEGFAKEEFAQIVHELETNFHSKQPGYIDSELLYNDKTDEWMMIQHWDGLENLQTASGKMFNNPITERYVKSLEPKRVKMLMLPQLGVWRCEAQDGPL